MIRVIGVRFRTAGKVYFFDPLQFDIKKGDHVIVETARGIEFGTVMAGIMDVAEEKVVQPLKPVIRIANQRDIEQEAANRDKEKEAFRICLEKIREHGLEMKLIDAEYTFDNNKVLFYFTADGRIDFRELVKDLASIFKTRIELRQIGVRDETKIVGGIGICGRPLCCHSYLSDFIPVSIKMAKEQNLSLNPAKISGVCGRLMCCLKNEEETYEELNRRLPGIGDSVTTEEGQKGTVQSVNVLRQLVKVVIDAGDEKEIKEYPVEKLRFRRRHSKKEKMELSQEELQELERLEEEEQQEQEAQEGGKKEAGQRQGGRNRQEGKNRHGGRGEDQRHSAGEKRFGESNRFSEFHREQKYTAENQRNAEGQRNAETQRNAENQRNAEGQRNAETQRSTENQRSAETQRNAENQRSTENQRGTENQRSTDRAEQRYGSGRQGGHRQSGQRFGGGQRAYGQRPAGERSEEGYRQQEYRPEGGQQPEGRYGGNRSRQDGRRRQYANSGERQGTRNRRDGRNNRHDGRAGQEERLKSDGNQA